MNRFSFSQKLFLAFATIIILSSLVGIITFSRYSQLVQDRRALDQLSQQNDLLWQQTAIVTGLQSRLQPLANEENPALFSEAIQEQIDWLEESSIQNELQNIDAILLSDIQTVEQVLVDLLDRTRTNATLGRWDEVRLGLATELFLYTREYFEQRDLYLAELISAETTLREEIANKQREAILRLATGFGALVVGVSVLGYWLSKEGRRLEAYAGLATTSPGEELEQRSVSILESQKLRRPSMWLDEMVASDVVLSTQIRYQTNQLAIFKAMSKLVSEDHTFDDFINQIVKLIAARFDFYHVGLFLKHPKNEQLELRAGSKSDGYRSIPINRKTLVGWSAYHHQPVLVSNVQFDNRHYRWPELPDTKSQLCLPLIIEGAVIGVLDIHTDRVNLITDSTRPIFQVIAEFVAISIYNLQERVNEYEGRKQAEWLKRVSEKLINPTDLSSTYRQALLDAAELIRFDLGILFSWDGVELNPSAVVLEGDDMRGVTPSLNRLTPDPEDGENWLSKLLADGEPIALANTSNDETLAAWGNLALQGSLACYPLRHADEMVGLLMLSRKEEKPFVREELDLIEKLSDQFAKAEERARIYHQLKRFNEQLEFEVQNRTKAIQTAYYELERLDLTKSNFVDIASHELRTPIAIIKGYGEILRSDPRLLNNPHYSTIISGILSGSDRISKIVENLLDISKIDYRTLALKPQAGQFQLILEKLLSELKDSVQERQIDLVVDPSVSNLPEFQFDHDALYKAFYHLLVNAVKFTPDGGRIDISANSWRMVPRNLDWPRQGVQIMIQDNGIGINPDDLEMIFNKFYQMGDARNHSSGTTKFMAGGTGLGLAIVRGIVTAHGGLVWAESVGMDSEAQPGSVFHVVLPFGEKEENKNGETDSLLDANRPSIYSNLFENSFFKQN